MISAYPSIFGLGHRAIADLFAEPVLIEEKVDGSQFSFGRLNGELVCRSKGVVVYEEAPGMFALAVETARAVFPSIPEGVVVRSEFLMKPKHNVIVYIRVPLRNLVVFDVSTGVESYLSYDEKREFASSLGLEVVPRLFQGHISSINEIQALLDTASFLGGTAVEGIVIKNYARFGLDKKVLMGKWVREDVKERMQREWKRSGGKKETLAAVITALRTEPRWQKTVQHMRDDGRLENIPRDIGALIRELQEDLVREEEDWIKTALYNGCIKNILRGVTSGFAEWYKQQLADSQFDNGGDRTCAPGDAPVIPMSGDNIDPTQGSGD